jgi:phosphoglycolate phosphatase
MQLPTKLPAIMVFDWDNTLVDNWPAITHALNAAFKAYGLPEWSLQRAKFDAHRSLRDSFPEWFGAEWEKAREIFYAAFEAVHLQTLTIMPGAAELLAWLQEKNQPMAIISNKSSKNLQREVDALQWRHYFSCVIGAGDAAKDKPNADPMDLLRSKLNLRPDADIWYIGDLASDIKFALVSKVFPIIINQERQFNALQFAHCSIFQARLAQVF